MPLSPTQKDDLRALAGAMIPASAEYRVPGADDPAIQADILATLGRDEPHIREAVQAVAGLAALDPAMRLKTALAVRDRGGTAVATLSRVILQCYYRDDRVVRSLGLEARAPYPKGHELEQGDWSLLDPVRARAPMWRRV